MTSKCACAVTWAAALLPVLPIVAASDDHLVASADLEWQLLGRSVCIIRTPAGVGTGFLVGPDCCIAPGHLLTGVCPAEAELLFSDPLDITPATPPAIGPITGRVSSIAFAWIDDSTRIAVLKLAPQNGLPVGERFGYLGARDDDALPGEPAHVVTSDCAGRKRCVHVESIYPADELRPDASASEFQYPSTADETWDGAPVFDERGCLIGIQLFAENGWARALRFNRLRTAMPSDGCAIEVCRLGDQDEFQFDTYGLSAGSIGHPLPPSLFDEPLPTLGRPSIRRVAGGSSAGPSARWGPPRIDWPEYQPPEPPDNPPPSDPPKTRKTPPSAPVDPPDAPPPDPPKPKPPKPSPPPHEVPEPGTLGLLLIGSGVLIRRLRG